MLRWCQCWRTGKDRWKRQAHAHVERWPLQPHHQRGPQTLFAQYWQTPAAYSLTLAVLLADLLSLSGKAKACRRRHLLTTGYTGAWIIAYWLRQIRRCALCI